MKKTKKHNKKINKKTRKHRKTKGGGLKEQNERVLHLLTFQMPIMLV